MPDLSSRPGPRLSLAPRYSLLVTRYSLLVTRYSLLVTLLSLSCTTAAPAPGDYALASVPDISQVGGESYMAWFKTHAVTPETRAFVARHRPALRAVYDELETLLAGVEGTQLQARRDPAHEDRLGLKKAHKVEEKIYRKLRQSQRHWRLYDAGNRLEPGCFPRDASPARARRQVFAAPPEAPCALRDIAGVRIVVPTLAAVSTVETRLREHFGRAIIRYKDYIEKDYRGDGYRSVHFVVVVQNHPVEIQLRTRRQHRWAKWEHDLIYKGRFKKDPDIRAYARKVARRLHQRDQGTCKPPCRLPACPPRLQKMQRCYPESNE